MLYQKLLEGVTPYFLDLSSGGPFELHRHPEIELNYCLNGSYSIIIDQKEYVLKKGDLAIINPMSAHELGNEYTSSALRLTIEIGPVFLGEQYNSFVTINQVSKILSLKNNSSNAIYKELISLLEETSQLLIDKPKFYDLSAKGNIYKISAVLLKILTKNSKESQTSVKSLIDVEKIGKAINIIYSRYSEPLTLDEVSSICGYSKSNFCKTFKIITGKSFHSMLNSHRIDVACLKLKELNLSIEDIALSVGFSDSKSFCRVFKKIIGKNAGEYRKTMK